MVLGGLVLGIFITPSGGPSFSFSFSPAPAPGLSFVSRGGGVFSPKAQPTPTTSRTRASQRAVAVRNGCICPFIKCERIGRRSEGNSS